VTDPDPHSRAKYQYALQLRGPLSVILLSRARSNVGENAWSSINHSILSELEGGREGGTYPPLPPKIYTVHRLLTHAGLFKANPDIG